MDRFFVFSVFSDKPKIDALVASLNRFNIDELRLIDVEWEGGDLSNRTGGGQKILEFHKELKHYFDNKFIDDNDIVIFTDAYDVIFNDDAGTIEERFIGFNKKILFAAERYCWPDINLSKDMDNIFLDSDFSDENCPKYLNSGLYIGRAKDIMSMLDTIKVDYNTTNESDDQELFQKYFIANNNDVGLDYESYIFQCLGNTLDDEVIIQNNKQILNTITRCCPCVVHANGNSMEHQVYKYLKEDLLYRTPLVIKGQSQEVKTILKPTLFKQVIRVKNDEAESKEILTYDFLTPEGCQYIIDRCEQFGNWEQMDGDKFPGQEIRIRKADRELYEELRNKFNETIIADAEKHWWPLLVHDIRDMFVIKYSTDGQTFLPMHHDASSISGSIKLNDGYKGGQLTFPRQNLTNEIADIGQAIIWPSNVTHGHMCVELTKGIKYSLTIWTGRFDGDVNY